jgi:hypothetical protein
MLLAAGLASPVLAQTQDETMPMDEQQMTQPMAQPRTSMQERRDALAMANPDAFITTVPALTYSVQDDRHAAVSYLDDAVGLLDLSRDQLRAGNTAEARIALMGASGKLTTAYLLNFRDHAFSQRIQPLAMRASEDLATLEGDNTMAMATLDSLRGQVASIGQQQLAMLPEATTGGGGGGDTGWEPLNFLATEQPTTDMNEINTPTDEELD